MLSEVFFSRTTFTTQLRCSRRVITRLSFGDNLLSNKRTDPSPQPTTSSERPSESQTRLVTQLSAPVGMSLKAEKKYRLQTQKLLKTLGFESRDFEKLRADKTQCHCKKEKSHVTEYFFHLLQVLTLQCSFPFPRTTKQ